LVKLIDAEGHFKRLNTFMEIENPMGRHDKPCDDASLAINEVQLILSEKRTALSILRTGITVFVLPLSVLSVLVATSRYYDTSQVMHFLIPLLGLCSGLVFLGFYLILRSILRLHRYDRLIRKIKQKHSAIAEFMD
jgi:uncharacterized membrane protein YidH (DUF202 family)